jgi:putative ABC transport system ATP-binding protein
VGGIKMSAILEAGKMNKKVELGKGNRLHIFKGYKLKNR